MEKREYVVWRTNKFDDDILVELVAHFNDLVLARDFVSYQSTLGNSFSIVCDGERIE